MEPPRKVKRNAGSNRAATLDRAATVRERAAVRSALLLAPSLTVAALFPTVAALLFIVRKIHENPRIPSEVVVPTVRRTDAGRQTRRYGRRGVQSLQRVRHRHRGRQGAGPRRRSR